MKHFMWKIFIVTTLALSLGFTPAVNADDEGQFLPVNGVVEEVHTDISIIVIADEDSGEILTIEGFPFNNLEAQLNEVLNPLDPDADSILIAAGDCMTIEYSFKTIYATEKIVNKFESLKMYCEDCGSYCYTDDVMKRKPVSNRQQPKPGHGQQGHGQGQVHGKPPVKPPGHDR